MDLLVPLIILVVAVILLFLIANVRRFTIFEYQRGLFYTRGKFTRLLEAGEYWYFRPLQTVQKVDIRTMHATIPGQEVLSADNISLRVSLATAYQVTDPYLAINQVANYQEALYLILQLNLRDVVGALDVDELLAKREQIGKQLFDRSAPKAAEIGVQLSLVNIKDIMFPGELKTIFAQVVKARKDGLAALERARGESAALRNLANAAKLLDGNPKLAQLRLYQLLESSAGNTVVLLPGENSPSLEKITSRRSKSETSSD
jgi:regulator of protease activity HflC (stomatin/prohibitin superfamily)